MHRRTLVIGLGAAGALTAAGLPVFLAAREEPAAQPASQPTSSAEHQQTVEALKPPKRARPVVAVIALNEGTEISDLLSTYGVLAESGLADVTVVADRADPIRLYSATPSTKAEPQATTAQFDAAHPEGADYVIVPAMEPTNDASVITWINAQHGKGAKIISVCNGAATVAAAGLLDGRRATGHWYYIEGIKAEHPTMQRVSDRRYVVDRGVATSTGITASIPLMLTLVESIGGRAEAEKLAQRLGVATWDARHDSSAFKLGLEHRITFLRNRLSFWRHDAIGIRLDDNVDEIALGFLIDAYSRTELAKVITVGGSGGAVQSRRGLRLQPDAPAAGAEVQTLLETPIEEPAATPARELPKIAARYDPATAALVALTMEYPWPQAEARRDQS